MIERPNEDALNNGIRIYRDAMRPFIIRQLRRAKGLQPTDAVRRSLHGNLRDNFDFNLNKNNDRLDATIDIGHFSWIIGDRDNWEQCFSRPFRSDRNVQSHLRLIYEGRNAVSHPDTGDLDRDEVHATLTHIINILGRINAPEERSSVEKIRESLIQPNLASQPATTAPDSPTITVPEPPEPQKTVSKPVSSLRHGLKPWRDVITPHPDVRSGAMTDSDFAANLLQVRDGLPGPREYSDPVEFFRRTYVTSGLRELIANSLKRINSKGGDPVIQTKTGFGGGKTHSLIALFHLVKNPDTLVAIADHQDDAVGREIYRIFNDAGVEPADSVAANVAAIIGTAASTTDVEAKTKEKGDPLNTLWGEMAYQLGGQDAYDIIGQAARQGTSPSEIELARLFDHVGPSLVLIDELVLYLRNLLPDQYDFAYTFIQNLTQAVSARKNVSLVVTLPQSRQEAGDDRGERILDTLQSIVGRIEAIRAPISTEEAFEVVRRRLFQEVKDQTELENTCEAFAKLYSSNKRDFPRESSQDNYIQRMKDCYPIHPEIFDRLFTDWSSIHQFQRTRGVLRLIAVCIRQLYERSDDPLIMPGDLPLDLTEFNAELTKILAFRGGGRWAPVVEEADGPNSRVGLLDANSDRFADLRGAAKRVSRTIFLGSVPGNNIHGLTQTQIHLGTAQPRQNIATYTEAINRMARELYYLHEANDRYFYNTEANLNRVHAEKVANISNDQVNRYIESELHRAIGRQRHVIVCPDTSADVQEDENVRIVVLTPDKQLRSRASDSDSAVDFANDAIMNRGEFARTNRNTLVFVTGKADDLRDLRRNAREHMAWVDILNDDNQDDLPSMRRSELRGRVERTRNTLNTALITAYRYVIAPTQRDPQRAEYNFVPARTNAVETGEIVAGAESKLVADEKLVDEIGTTVLYRVLDQYIWSNQHDHITFDELWNLFTTHVYLPRLRNKAVLQNAIMRGTVEGAFGYADSYDGERYANLRFKQSIGAASTAINYDLFDRAALVVNSKIAEVQIHLEQEEAQQSGDPEPGSDPGTPFQPEPDDPDYDDDYGPKSSPSPPPFGPSQITATKQLQGDINLNDVSEIQAEIIRNLRDDGGDVTVTITVSASKEGGFSQNTLRAIRENGDALQLELQIQESDNF